MSTQLANRLMLARRSYFVGRAFERDLFQSALTADELPFFVLYIYGPGGVGKSSLLTEFIQLCEQANVPAVYLDGRDVEPSPETFLAGLGSSMGLAPHSSPLSALSAQAQRYVILLDTYEMLAPLDRWLRQEFLPQLSENVVTVLAGQSPPAVAWRADPGWQSLVRILPIRNLNPEEAREYLTRRRVPEHEHQAILDFTYSYPLALSLVAEEFAQRTNIHFEPEGASDVVRSLLERLVRRVPGPAHRAALEACAMIRVTTEPLLAEMLGITDSHELFEWLRSLSFITANREGLFPHDLVRETLSADLRWRNPDWYEELHRRARSYFTTRLHHTSGQAQQRLLMDFVFLHRDNPVLRPFLDWQMRDSSYLTDIMRKADVPILLDMVARHEGEESAGIARHWFKRQPECVVVYRNEQGAPEGFLCSLALHQASAEDLSMDPTAQLVWHHIQQQHPLRAGEKATLFRFWMAADTYQQVSTVQSLVFISALQHYLTTPGLAITFFACAEPDFWEILFTYANVTRLPQTDFEVGGRRYGVYFHDWRVETPLAWLALMAEREMAAEPPSVSPGPAGEGLLVLCQPDFASAVRDALHDYTRPDHLYDNPLLRSRLIVKQVGISATADMRAATLRSVLQETSETLQTSPREAKYYRALNRTYFHPAPTQEVAAELLDLPFSTYRRHLKAGIDRVTEILWHAELGTS